MTRLENISDRLEAAAATTDSDQARTALTKAANKFSSYAHAPGTKKDADRIAGVLTREVIAVVGEAFLQQRTAEIAGLDSGPFSTEFRESGYALAALLIASGDSELSDVARALISRVAELVEQMDPTQAEQVQFVAGLYPDIEASTALTSAARERLALEPATLAASWSAQLGLGLPEEYWAVNLALPCELVEGRADAGIYADIEHRPGTPSKWSIRIGALNRDVLGSDRWGVEEDAPAVPYDRGRGIAGQVRAATGPLDVPRLLRDIEAAHPELTFQRASLKASGTPGRLLSPTKKKRLIAWLSESEEPAS